MRILEKEDERWQRSDDGEGLQGINEAREPEEAPQDHIEADLCINGGVLGASREAIKEDGPCSQPPFTSHRGKSVNIPGLTPGTWKRLTPVDSQWGTETEMGAGETGRKVEYGGKKD